MDLKIHRKSIVLSMDFYSFMISIVGMVERGIEYLKVRWQDATLFVYFDFFL